MATRKRSKVIVRKPLANRQVGVAFTRYEWIEVVRAILQEAYEDYVKLKTAEVFWPPWHGHRVRLRDRMEGWDSGTRTWVKKAVKCLDPIVMKTQKKFDRLDAFREGAEEADRDYLARDISKEEVIKRYFGYNMMSERYLYRKMPLKESLMRELLDRYVSKDARVGILKAWDEWEAKWEAERKEREAERKKADTRKK